MGHLGNSKEAVYMALSERLSKMPVGTPINETLMEILYRLYTESEAMVGSKFSFVPMGLDDITQITGMKKEALAKILDDMAAKGLVIDFPTPNGTHYMLNQMFVGFFEMTFMRMRDGYNMKELAELFDIYFQKPEVWDEFTGSDTKLMQALVYEKLVPAVVETEVLDYEKASEIIHQSGGGALTLCACRHKASHLGKTCTAGAPMETCTILGNMAQWLIQKGMGRPATVDELLQVLDRTEKLGLAHLGDNVLKQPFFICHCCSCCCNALRPTIMYGKLFVNPSNFIPALELDNCVGCGTCADRCVAKVITMRETENGVEVPEVNDWLCLGCGVCASTCPNGALIMSRRSVLHVPPENAMDLQTRIAKEKNRI
jgi:ferredoxin